MTKSPQRIAYLDGLRGIAIFSVVLFHAYVSSPLYLPFGDAYQVIPLMYGWTGVQLFFLISGFVILMTLEASSGFFDFIYRRWLRLFPAMLIATSMILVFNCTVHIGPYSNRSIIDAIPGLLFISPALINALSGIALQSLDGPFWTLYVEVVFYFVFSSIFFAAGSRAAIAGIMAIAFVAYCMNFMTSFGQDSPLFIRVTKATDWIGFTEFAWFGSGALFYLYYRSRSSITFALACLAGTLGVCSSGPTTFSSFDRLAMFGILIFFAVCTVSQCLQRIISFKPFLFFGFISYPLYLIHNNAVVGLENAVSRFFSKDFLWLAPILPIAALVVVSWIIAARLEPNLRRLIVYLFRLIRPSPSLAR